ncbi:hypothetical protein D3C76_1087690 [compost metagenome]
MGRNSRRDLWLTAQVQLLFQRAEIVVEHQPGYRQSQQPVFGRQLLRRPYVNAAGAVEQGRFTAGGDDPHDQVLQLLAVTGLVFVPDQQVEREPLLAPVGMGQHYLLDQMNVGRVADLYQHDRQVARHPLAPQAGLVAPVAGQ